MRRRKQLGSWPHHEALRLRQVADILERDAATLRSENGGYIVPRRVHPDRVELMKSLTDVRSKYGVMINGHVPVHMVELAHHVRHTADLLEGQR